MQSLNIWDCWRKWFPRTSGACGQPSSSDCGTVTERTSLQIKGNQMPWWWWHKQPVQNTPEFCPSQAYSWVSVVLKIVICGPLEPLAFLISTLQTITKNPPHHKPHQSVASSLKYVKLQINLNASPGCGGNIFMEPKKEKSWTSIYCLSL